MGDEGRWDAARQAANLAGALFQIGAPVLTSEAVGRISAENGTLVVPADYAFSIWGLIFLLCLAYAAYGARCPRTARVRSCDAWAGFRPEHFSSMACGRYYFRPASSSSRRQ